MSSKLFSSCAGKTCLATPRKPIGFLGLASCSSLPVPVKQGKLGKTTKHVLNFVDDIFFIAGLGSHFLEKLCTRKPCLARGLPFGLLCADLHEEGGAAVLLGVSRGPHTDHRFCLISKTHQVSAL